MTDEDLPWAPAHVLAPMIARKALSPTELTRAVLARIAAKEPGINAFAALDEDGALRQAAAAEAALARGDALGPLHGLTVTIKDLMATAGLPFARGSRIHAGETAAEDAPVVTRLRQAGATVLGKTTTSEFGWSGVSHSPLTGITHNPWRHGMNAGASSAGAGAAAAAGYGALHQGSDGAGSIRMPAHFCGVYGLKPSFGRVPYGPPGNNDYMSHIGPLTRTVADAALMLRAMAGPHPWDQTSLEAPPADYPALLRQGGLAGKRVAFSPDLGHARVDPEVAALVRQAADRMAGLGARVEEVTPPWGPDGAELIRYFWPAHMSLHLRRLPEWEDRMDPGLVACARMGVGRGVSEYVQMRERKLAYSMAVNRWLEDWDFLVTPAVSTAAFPAGLLQPEHWPQHPWDWLMWAEFSYPFNASHAPAASIPCGFTAAGLPVGVQIVGRRLDDLGVLQASAAYEAAHPWADKRPDESLIGSG